MTDFKKDLKENNFKRVYLFYGEEDFLREHYEKRAIEKIVPGAELTDLEIIDGKGYSVEILARAFETPPFMSGRRLIIFKDTGLFAAGKKDETEKTEKYISKILAAKETPFTVAIFSEIKTDKRGRLYKTVEKAGGAAEFKTPPEKELISWIAGLFKKSEIKIEPEAAALLVRYASDMNALCLETEKLIAYKGAGGTVGPRDVELLCAKSIDVKIFGLIAAIGNKEQAAAVNMYRDLLAEKESPFHILSLIARQLGIIMSVKELAAQGKNAYDASAVLGLRSFITAEAYKQARLFSAGYLAEAFNECLETDFSIKTGRIAERLAVELLIIKYSA